MHVGTKGPIRTDLFCVVFQRVLASWIWSLMRTKTYAALGFCVFLLLAIFSAGVSAQSEDPDVEVDPNAEVDPGVEAEPEVDPLLLEQLREGSQVYSQICSSCHQPGGVGLAPNYPPLLGNPNVEDASYLEEVIDDGKRGELTVLGETYDGVMPSFSTLNDEETAAVIAFIQNDFQVPAGGDEAFGPVGPVAGTSLPALADLGYIVAYLLAAVVALLVLAPRLTSTNDRLDVPWLDVGLKTAVIVLSVALFVVYIPNWILKTTTVAKLGRFAQDFIGVSAWGIGLAAVLWGLWYAHKDSRI
jgi:mono/diheme cytochrome c family protein